MTVSSRSGGNRCRWGEPSVVAQQCPEHVDEAAGQGEQGLVWMRFSPRLRW